MLMRMNFRPFLNASKRELLADCALPVSVLLMSFFGSYVFRDVKRTYIQTKALVASSQLYDSTVQQLFARNYNMNRSCERRLA